MQWFHSSDKPIGPDGRSPSGAEIKPGFAEHRKSLYWIALMVKANAELAERSVIDAGSFAETNSAAFRAWLFHWSQVATARAAANAVCSSIHDSGSQYADWICSHRRHEPLTPAESRNLCELNAFDVVESLDVLARAVLVLYGCECVSFSECQLILSVPLQSVVGAYCRALQWHRAFLDPADPTRCPHSSELHLVRHDPDGLPVWG